MSTPELIKIPAATIEKQYYLDALSEHLSEVDIARLNAILAKFKNDEASIADCLKIFPKRSPDAAQSDFRSFRDRLKKAGVSAGVQVSLEVDTMKHLPSSKRRCWFLAPNDAAEKIAEFSKNSADLFDSLIESQMALPVEGKSLSLLAT